MLRGMSLNCPLQAAASPAAEHRLAWMSNRFQAVPCYAVKSKRRVGVMEARWRGACEVFLMCCIDALQLY